MSVLLLSSYLPLQDMGHIYREQLGENWVHFQKSGAHIWNVYLRWGKQLFHQNKYLVHGVVR